jgi:hypothetical protein
VPDQKYPLRLASGMMVDMSTQNPRRALVHPLFWIALVVLLVNDHLLKQAHVLPGVVTGKLSDFAGMVVAPVELMALLRLRGRAGRMVAFACVAAAFAAIKLSRSCADLVETVTAYTPLPWRLWCDPTDLLAMSMLPLAWWLCEGRDEAAVGVRLASCLHAAGLVLGVFACAASSSSVERYVGTAFLFNGTMRTQSVRLYRLQTPLDRTRLLDDPAMWPGRDAFALRTCTTLAPRDILGLDQGWRDLGTWSPLGEGFSAEPVDAGVTGSTCDAVLLQADGLQSVVVTWNGVSPIVFMGAEFFGETANDGHGLILEQAGKRVFIQGTTSLAATGTCLRFCSRPSSTCRGHGAGRAEGCVPIWRCPSVRPGRSSPGPGRARWPKNGIAEPASAWARLWASNSTSAVAGASWRKPTTKSATCQRTWWKHR